MNHKRPNRFVRWLRVREENRVLVEMVTDLVGRVQERDDTIANLRNHSSGEHRCCTHAAWWQHKAMALNIRRQQLEAQIASDQAFLAALTGDRLPEKP